MRILCTNDDGIHAHGLTVLESIARELSDDVWVVAPESDQSGVAHSLSLNDPLRLRKISERHFAVKGTPTDCVIMGVRRILFEHRPDLVHPLDRAQPGLRRRQPGRHPLGLRGAPCARHHPQASGGRLPEAHARQRQFPELRA
jgi:hypothetical protein